MNGDEFNKVSVNNERDGFSSIEFGKIQRAEYTFKDENKTKIEDDANKNPEEVESGIKVEEKIESEEEGEEEKKKETASSTTSTLTSSTSVTSVSGFFAGATAATVGTATLIGVNVIMSTKCNVNNIDTTPISVHYDVEISDKNDDIVVINLENKDIDFSETKELEEGPNIDSFQNLLPSCKYTLSVVDQKYNNVLYTSDVTTQKEDILKLANVEIDIDNYISHSATSFSVKLNYSGEVENISDIKLHLINPEKKVKEYDLEKTTESQVIELNRPTDSFLFTFSESKGYDYYLTYMYKDERVRLENKHFKFYVEAVPMSDEVSEDTLKSFYFTYWSNNDDNLFVKYEIDNSNHIYSNPKISFVALDEVDPEDTSPREYEFFLPNINNGYNQTAIKMNAIRFSNIDRIFGYYFSCYDNDLEDDVYLASGLIDFRLMHPQIRVGRHATYFYEKDGNIYLPLNFKFNNNNSEYKTLYFNPIHYRYEDDAKIDDYIDKITINNGTSIIKLSEDLSAGRNKLTVLGFMINNRTSKTSVETVYNFNVSNNPNDYQVLERLTHNAFVGGHISSQLLDKKDPKVKLYLNYNDLTSITDAKVLVQMANPDEYSDVFEFPFDVSELAENGNSLTLDLKTYGKNIYSLIKSSPLSISISYKTEVENEFGEVVTIEENCPVYESIILNYKN